MSARRGRKPDLEMLKNANYLTRVNHYTIFSEVTSVSNIQVSGVQQLVSVYTIVCSPPKV